MPRLFNRLVNAAALFTGIHCRMARNRRLWYFDYNGALDEMSRKHNHGVTSHFMIETEPYAESMTENHLCRQFAHRGLDLPPEKRSPTLVKLLKVLHCYFTTYDIEYWLDGGTLLGGYRDGHIIPWDEDADVCIRAPALARLLQIAPAHPFADPDCLLIFRKGAYRLGNPLPAADFIPCILVDKRNGVFVDIFLWHELDDRWLKMYWWGPCPKCRNFGVKFRKSMIFPLKQIVLEGQSYPCPNRTMEYLKGYYGDLRPRRTNCT